MYGAPATSAGTPAAYAHKSPGQGHCTATPGWPGGRDGRKSIKSKIIDTTATDSAIVGNMPHLFRTASPAQAPRVVYAQGHPYLASRADRHRPWVVASPRQVL